MDINIEAYRSRIGSFISSNHISYIPENSRRQSCKQSTKTIYDFRKLITYLVLIISILSTLQVLPRKFKIQDKILH